MTNNRISFLLALGIIGNIFSTPIEAKTLIAQEIKSVANQDNNSTVQAVDTLGKIKLSYDALMKAGYAADKQREYARALTYFRQALTLRPNDSWASNAVNNITTYGFDRYMQAGYQADLKRDYQLALQNFQKALEIKPNSFYAQKAVANTSEYLTINAQKPPNQESKNKLNLMLMLLGIGGTAAISAILLFFLFKKSNNINLNPVITETDNNSQDSIPVSHLDETEAKIDNIEPENSPSENIDLVEEETLIAPSQTIPTSEAETVEDPLQEIETQKTEPSKNEIILSSDSQISKMDMVLELISDLQKSDRQIRQRTIWELAQKGDSRAMQPLVELMINVDSQERGLILEAMTQIASRTLKPMNQALMMSLEDNNPSVKQNAIRDLTRVYELMNQVTQRLSLVVDDSDEEVQKTAEWALKQLNQLPKVPVWQNSNLNSNNKDIN